MGKPQRKYTPEFRRQMVELHRAAICAHPGFTTDRREKVAGARALSASTTRAVALASISVLVADFLLTSLLT